VHPELRDLGAGHTAACHLNDPAMRAAAS